MSTLGVVSRYGRESLKETSGMTSFWSKTFCDLSLVTMLALKQVSVINDLKGRKDCRNEGKAVKKQCVWTPLVV